MTHQVRASFRLPRFAHRATFRRLPHIEDPHGLDVAIVGVPFDGPSAITALLAAKLMVEFLCVLASPTI